MPLREAAHRQRAIRPAARWLPAFGRYAFDRFNFEGENYSDRRHNRIDIDAGPLVAAQVSVRF
jgi:hypothetical protein